MECFFCNLDKSKYVFENDLAFSFYDEFAVTKGHMLFITKRHISDIFEATEAERTAIWELIEKAKEMLDELYHPDGYNIGLNAGVAAGQTVMHLHVHLFPRYIGDVENPKGGVRGIIPDKQKY